MQVLPLFPLGIVAFPGEKLNLHIFEDRYKELISECDMYQKPFGISPVLDNSLMEVGTEVELVAIERVYPDGKMDVKTKGKRIYRLRDFRERAAGKQYAEGDVVFITQHDDPNPDQQQYIHDQIIELFSVMNVSKDIGSADQLRCFDVGHHIGLNTQQKIDLLKLSRESERQAFVLDHLSKIIPMAKEMEDLKRRIQLNGHFKHIQPPDIFD